MVNAGLFGSSDPPEQGDAVGVGVPSGRMPMSRISLEYPPQSAFLSSSATASKSSKKVVSQGRKQRNRFACGNRR